MKKIFILLLICSFSLVLSSCSLLDFLQNGDDQTQDSGSGDDEDDKLTVAPKDFVAVRNDDRDAVYTHYSKDGEALESFASLYAAINSCVNEGDIEDYVIKNGS